ncbi:hypothetical protein BFW01_g9947 [Lasiodiplodia theobromae]|uniref:uncharacterized protein n=1 Tax=Lasiodiplodia theobromae TaxID=45133 RepID=UPI0015C3C6D6|nr:uncharacterized protein LTHEOB_5142 [Lasiodiplodia theobromae]KAF4545309.1 hypothetical protein LTHEOB_5142 [Lasiodiplodia theobromae]KAF9639050.1 hypothetical protein BFW01_g9947 [Lasiodiplodia theobromae]
MNLQRQRLFEIAVGGIQTTRDDGTIKLLQKLVQEYDELEGEIDNWKATVNDTHDTLGDLNYHFDLGQSHREMIDDMCYLERSSQEQYDRLRSIKATKREELEEITRVR